jgi:hypothetical protein
MRTVRLVTLVTVLAACSDSTSPTSDVNALVDQMTGSGIASYSTTAMAAAGVTTSVVPVPSSGSSPCAYSATTQFFECTPITSNGVTMSRSFQLLDTSGHPLATLDPTAVASIRTISDIKGTPTAPGMVAPPMTINRHEDATMSDLKSSTHVLNGTATQTMTMTLATGTFSSNQTSTTTNLLLPKPTAEVHWPLGGTITTDGIMTFNGGTPTTTHDVISFDGTSIMTVKHTVGNQTCTSKIDLSKPPTAVNIVTCV